MASQYFKENECVEAMDYWKDLNNDIQQNPSDNERYREEAVSETQKPLSAPHDNVFSVLDIKKPSYLEEGGCKRIEGKCYVYEQKNAVEGEVLFSEDSCKTVGWDDVSRHEKSAHKVHVFQAKEEENFGQKCVMNYRERKIKEGKTVITNSKPIKHLDARCGERGDHVIIQNQQSMREMFHESPGKYLKAQKINTSIDTAGSTERKLDYEKGKVKKLVETKVQENIPSTELIGGNFQRLNNGSPSKLLNPSTPEDPWPDREKVSASTEEKSSYHVYENKIATEGSVKQRCVSNVNQSTQKILDDAIKIFQSGDENVNEWLDLPSGLSKECGTKKKSTIFNRKKESPAYCSIDTNDDIKTLEDALKYFNLSSSLQKLEKSLDEVRSCRKTKKQHEDLLKSIDKEMQKLSLTYHPDKVKSQGGNEEDLVKAQRIQATLNATRTVLNILSTEFLDDIGTDHKYGFYAKLHMSNLGNENEIKNRIYEVLFKIGMVSEIKQEHIISEIRKFLIESKCCVKEYLENHVKGFEKYRDLALFHLKCCVKGYEKLHLEIKEVEKECKRDKLDNISSVVFKMGNDCKRDLSVLKALQKTAENSLKNYKFFNPHEHVDPYFVLPFVVYVNVILMCNVMMKQTSIWGVVTSSSAELLHTASCFDSTSLVFESLKNLSPFGKSSECSEVLPEKNGELIYLTDLHYLTSCYCGNYNKEMVEKILTNNGCNVSTPLSKDNLCKNVIKETFSKILRDISSGLEVMFKVENYVEGTSKNLLKEEIKRCVTMMYTFEKKKKELLQDVENFKKKTKAMEKEFDKYDKLLLETEELNKNVAESLQMNEKVSEIISSFISDKL